MYDFPRYGELTVALGRVLDDYSLVKFFPLDITNEENVQASIYLVFTILNENMEQFLRCTGLVGELSTSVRLYSLRLK